MTRLYKYVGPAHITDSLDLTSPGAAIKKPVDVKRWIEAHTDEIDANTITATFTLDPDGTLRLASRHSEHVVCAGGGPVLGAGEITFDLNPPLSVDDISNQSTGFCPEPSCWTHIQRSLDAIGLMHPGGLTRSFVFRLCEGCGQRNLIKEGWYECAVCGDALPQDWNFEPRLDSGADASQGGHVVESDESEKQG